MTQTIDEVIAEAGGPGPLTPLSRRQVIPYLALNALNMPSDLNQITNALLSVLAIGVAQGPDKPELLTSDTLGRLRTSAVPASVTKFTAAFVGGATTAVVADTSGFFPGQFVVLTPADGVSASCTEVEIRAIPDGHTLKFAATCGGVNFQIGDFIVGGGSTRVDAVVAPVHIGTTITMIPTGGPNPGDQDIGSVSTIAGHKRLMVDTARSYDWQVCGAMQAGGTITKTIVPQSSTERVVVGMFAFNMNSNVAGDFAHYQIWQDAVTTGTILLDGFLQVQPATNVDRYALAAIAMIGNVNKNIVVTSIAGAGTVNHSLTAMGWFEG